jgi:hypothetical protein
MKPRRQLQQDSETALPVPHFSVGHLDVTFFVADSPTNAEVAQYVRAAVNDRSERNPEAGSASPSILLDVSMLLAIMFMPSMLHSAPFASVTVLTCAILWFLYRIGLHLIGEPDREASFLHSDRSPLTDRELDQYDPGSTSNVLADIRREGL